MRVFAHCLTLCPAAILLAACQPPDQDGPSQRVDLAAGTTGPSTPIASPDTADAIWSPDGEARLLFGNVGAAPFLSLECVEPGTDDAAIRIVRHIPADAEAQALFAFIGNGTMARIPVEATWRGNRWRWEGEISANAADLDTLTGRRALYATLPGGGRLDLPASAAPGEFIDRCRTGSRP